VSELQAKTFDEPDEIVSAPGLRGQIVVIGETHVGRYVHEPGWHWAKDIKPMVGTPYCQVHHQGVMLSGHMQIVYSNGAQKVIGPGEAFNIPPGHDGFVIGDEPCISIEFRGVREWVKPAVAGERVLTTMLFTDIVGSTAAATQMGDTAWNTRLAQHNERVRFQLELFRGHELTTTGDGFLAMFDGTARAIKCADAISKASRADDIEVRAGIHTGEIELRPENAQGLAIHIAARVMSLAKAGEVMISASTVALLEGSGLSFADAGEHELRGVEGKRRIYRLISEQG
jgi:class 3 adenylate cyclase